jgi:hypothetical protein
VFAIASWRGGCGWGACPGAAGVKLVSSVDAEIGLAAMIAWYEAGTKKLLELKQMLQNPTLSQETAPTHVSTP